MNPKCLGGSVPDTFDAKSAHLTGLKMIRITRAASFDHLVGAGKKRRRDFDAQTLGGLQIDDQFEFRRQRDWQVGWLLALENPAGVDTNLSIGSRPTFTGSSPVANTIGIVAVAVLAACAAASPPATIRAH